MDLFDNFDSKLISGYSLLLFVIAGIIYILYAAAKDPNSAKTNTYIYIFILSIPLIAILYFTLSFFGNVLDTKHIVTVFFVVVLAAVSMYFYFAMNKDYFNSFGYISSGLVILISLVALALLFLLLSNYLKSFTGWSGFVVYFIFYIPCLILDFFRYLMKEMKMTSHLVYAVFLAEIILIILYIFIPQLINKIDMKDGIVLLEKGAFLDTTMDIGSGNIMKIPKNKLVNKDSGTVFNKNYAFSMWVYLNVQSDNFLAYSKETTIFSCGNGKPKITYFNNINEDDKKNKYIFYFTDLKKGPSKFELSLPNQKWNNFVFNYDYNKVDLFVNGELVRTFQFGSNRPKYRATDKISIGSEDGLNGAICNVRYYPDKLSNAHIISTYNLLMYKNPPVFIL
jgi:hypothetical protein